MNRRFKAISRNLVFLAAPAAIFAAAQTGSAGCAGESGKPQAVRVIQDPHTGMRWLLERTAGYPGGPGRMVLLTDKVAANREATICANDRAQTEPVATPVIRAGDRLVVEEHSAIVDARLEGVALGPAVKGAAFNIRLSVGGKVVRAVAAGPGRATFAPSEGLR